MAAKRYRSSSITIDVPVSDVLDEIDDDDLLKEVRNRELELPAGVEASIGCDRSYAEEAILLLRTGRSWDALTLLERALHPKFQDRAACEKALAKVRMSA